MLKNSQEQQKNDQKSTTVGQMWLKSCLKAAKRDQKWVKVGNVGKSAKKCMVWSWHMLIFMAYPPTYRGLFADQGQLEPTRVDQGRLWHQNGKLPSVPAHGPCVVAIAEQSSGYS